MFHEKVGLVPVVQSVSTLHCSRFDPSAAKIHHELGEMASRPVKTLIDLLNDFF